MSGFPHDFRLSEVARLALGTARAEHRAIWLALFALDARLAQSVAQAREPLPAQMRLAWWRDELRKPAAQRVRGDAVLDLVGAAWDGSDEALVALVDGWEELLGEPPLSSEALSAFASGRGAACAALADRIGCDEAAGTARRAGEIWSLAELSSRCREEQERGQALVLTREISGTSARLPRALRPLAVLRGLALRAVARGGAPLIGDRLSPLAAFRLGILGR